MYVCMYVLCMCVCMYVCMYVRIMCVCLCVYVCMSRLRPGNQQNNLHAPFHYRTNQAYNTFLSIDHQFQHYGILTVPCCRCVVRIPYRIPQQPHTTRREQISLLRKIPKHA